ncbi:dihydropteroate synthase [Parvularcula bermudensis HTCC2503]|uniref:Dihydropteroate synthase n=1 Tax=Parvularcula bermudensis (strain ATCC BAA-594 / HTCC2503 / KCTC 12087) TaxID=314260 RepID=E0TID8_PARBH|nr:dihydropteroate synthase [Parvularcula bermudensis]ADM09722.1 dihydropteroate synthase [Parvularcula bermudensis HTCC2503]
MIDPSLQIVGILNVTPDSFSDGGRYKGLDAALSQAERLAAEGATIIDIGGESTRPGAKPVASAEEQSRVIPVIRALRRELPDIPLSIDTRRPETARAAMGEGASIWNDVSALTFAEDSLATAADLGVRVILMHAQGDPQTMQCAPRYTDVVEEVFAFLAARIAVCEAAGIPKNRLIVDPGIGFGKTLDHNLALLSGLDRFTALGPPLLIGASRKRFIAALDREGPAAERLGGSVAAVIESYRRGAKLFRVHDVAATRQALAVAAAISPPDEAL